MNAKSGFRLTRLVALADQTSDPDPSGTGRGRVSECGAGGTLHSWKAGNTPVRAQPVLERRRTIKPEPLNMFMKVGRLCERPEPLRNGRAT